MTKFTHSGVRTFLKAEASGNQNTFHISQLVLRYAVFPARLDVRNIIKRHFLRKDSKPRTNESNEGL